MIWKITSSSVFIAKLKAPGTPLVVKNRVLNIIVDINLKIGFKNNKIFVMTETEVLNVLSKVEHPAIRYSLLELGIVTDVELTGNKVKVVFAFPFPNIPIADFLIQSVAKPIKHLGLEFEYTTRVMNDEERNLFLQLEAEAWKG